MCLSLLTSSIYLTDGRCPFYSLFNTEQIYSSIFKQALNIEKDKEWVVYANEADLLSVAVFGYTAKQWKEANPSLHLKGLNMRDLADAHQLLVLSNLEGYNAILIEKGFDKYQRLIELRKASLQQLVSLRKSIYTEEKIKSPYLPDKKKIDISQIGFNVQQSDSENE
ncbi:MAG: DNA-binding protein [Mucilaginibacter sp.]|nr:DNA-binding protein [Mucilaginibacter sp.]